MSLSINLLAKALLLQFLVISTSVDLNPESNGGLRLLVDEVSTERLMNHVWSLTGYGTRYALTVECNQSAQFLYDYFSSLEGFNVTYHHFRIGIRLGGRNVVAFKSGTTNADEYVLLFAHYDSISSDPYNLAPGADDNACGVAAMMEVAYLMSKRDWNRSLLFIAFSAEELGFIGSETWVRDHAEILDNIVAGICLDGVGRGEGIWIMFADYESKPLADLMVNVSRRLGFEEFYGAESSLAVGGSDSAAFLGRGVRIIRLWDKDRTYIHTPQDTPDTLNPRRLLETAKVVAATLYLLLTKPLGELFPETLQIRPREDGGKPFNIKTMISITCLTLSAVLILMVKRRLKLIRRRAS